MPFEPASEFYFPPAAAPTSVATTEAQVPVVGIAKKPKSPSLCQRGVGGFTEQSVQ